MFLLLSGKMECDCDVVDWRCYTERTQVARSVTVLNTTRGSTIWWQSVYLFSQPAHPTVWSDLWFPTILKPSSMLHWKSAVGKSTQVDTKDTFQRRLANEMSSGTSVADQPQTVLWLVTGPRVHHWSEARRTWELSVERHAPQQHCVHATCFWWHHALLHPNSSLALILTESPKVLENCFGENITHWVGSGVGRSCKFSCC